MHMLPTYNIGNLCNYIIKYRLLLKQTGQTTAYCNLPRHYL